MNLLFHTPRLTESEIDSRGKILFEQMLTKGNVKTYFGNRLFIQTPNKDFYYDTKHNRWDYTQNSSWRFLQEARDSASQKLVN